MPRAIMMTLLGYGVSAMSVPQTTEAQAKLDRTYVVSAQTVKAMEAAAPDTPVVPPRKPRRVLVYGRVPTHPESVACCFRAMEILGQDLLRQKSLMMTSIHSPSLEDLSNY